MTAPFPRDQTPEKALARRVVPHMTVQTDEGGFTRKNILVLRADEEIVDDRIIDEPEKQDERDQDPPERQQSG